MVCTFASFFFISSTYFNLFLFRFCCYILSSFKFRWDFFRFSSLSLWLSGCVHFICFFLAAVKLEFTSIPLNVKSNWTTIQLFEWFSLYRNCKKKEAVQMRNKKKGKSSVLDILHAKLKMWKSWTHQVEFLSLFHPQLTQNHETDPRSVDLITQNQFNWIQLKTHNNWHLTMAMVLLSVSISLSLSLCLWL